MPQFVIVRRSDLQSTLQLCERITNLDTIALGMIPQSGNSEANGSSSTTSDPLVITPATKHAVHNTNLLSAKIILASLQLWDSTMLGDRTLPTHTVVTLATWHPLGRLVGIS